MLRDGSLFVPIQYPQDYPHYTHNINKSNMSTQIITSCPQLIHIPSTTYPQHVHNFFNGYARLIHIPKLFLITHKRVSHNPLRCARISNAYPIFASALAKENRPRVQPKAVQSFIRLRLDDAKQMRRAGKERQPRRQLVDVGAERTERSRQSVERGVSGEAQTR